MEPTELESLSASALAYGPFFFVVAFWFYLSHIYYRRYLEQQKLSAESNVENTEIFQKEIDTHKKLYLGVFWASIILTIICISHWFYRSYEDFNNKFAAITVKDLASDNTIFSASNETFVGQPLRHAEDGVGHQAIIIDVSKSPKPEVTVILANENGRNRVTIPLREVKLNDTGPTCFRVVSASAPETATIENIPHNLAPFVTAAIQNEPAETRKSQKILPCEDPLAVNGNHHWHPLIASAFAEDDIFSAQTSFFDDAANIDLVAYQAELILRYFAKKADDRNLPRVLGGFGLRLEVRHDVNHPDTPTNAIWFGEKVDLEIVQEVAFELIDAGVEIKALGPFPPPRGRKYNVIEIGSILPENLPSNRSMTKVDVIGLLSFIENYRDRF